jgi:hypothetical protein
MEPSETATQEKNLWEDFRETVRGGLHDLRNVGDELARQGRLRMDICQTERRLKNAYEDLGRAAHDRISESHPVTVEDSAIGELNLRIGYYCAELKRLHEDLQHTSEHLN